jgi:hypothetical protein
MVRMNFFFKKMIKDDHKARLGVVLDSVELEKKWEKIHSANSAKVTLVPLRAFEALINRKKEQIQKGGFSRSKLDHYHERIQHTFDHVSVFRNDLDGFTTKLIGDIDSIGKQVQNVKEFLINADKDMAKEETSKLIEK